MKKHILPLLVAVLFIISISIPTFAADMTTQEETEAERTERVYEEVLTGNITNQEDVLEVALAQYLASGSYNPNSRAVTDNAPLNITQVLDVKTDDEGNTVEKTVACTALIVLDNEGRSISATEFANYHKSTTGNSQTYGIYATHTMYAQTRSTDPDNTSLIDEHVRVVKMTTSFVQTSIYTPTKIVQNHYACRDAVGLDEIFESKTFSNPTAGTTYTYTPSVFWVDRGDILGSQIQTSVQIYIGDEEIISAYNLQRLDPLGEWVLESGW